MANIPDGTTPIVNNLHAPEVFADTCVGLLLQDENMRFTFGSLRSNYGDDSQAALVIVARLVMPLARAEQFQQFLAQFIADMKAQAASGQPQGSRTLN